jgi:DNA modification methylase
MPAKKKGSAVKEPQPLREITHDEYLAFIKKSKFVTIEDAEIEIGKKHEIESFQPSNFQLETGSVWSFPQRGDWATHKGDYRGNWPPPLVRNLVLRYSKPGELVLDQMCGGGTTLVECKLLNRNSIGVDINLDSIMLSHDRLNFSYKTLDEGYIAPKQTLFQGDARNLESIKNDSINLIATHPPYAGIIRYSKNHRIEGDLSSLSITNYLLSMSEIAKESFRVLKKGRFCAILIGDTRQHRHYVPIAFRVMQSFLGEGFVLREDIIKQQWKLKKSGERWAGLVKKADENWVDKPEGKRFWTDFFLILHEHLFVFEKPRDKDDYTRLKNSSKWW